MNPTGALELIITTICDIYIMIVLARFILQMVRADFYNPVSQFIVKATSPVLNPLRRIIPGFGGLDVASIALFDPGFPQALHLAHAQRLRVCSDSITGIRGSDAPFPGEYHNQLFQFLYFHHGYPQLGISGLL